MKYKLVLGIDAGYENLGLSLFESDGNIFLAKALGCIVAPKPSKAARRDLYVSDEIIMRVETTISGLRKFIQENIKKTISYNVQKNVSIESKADKLLAHLGITNAKVLCCIEMPTGASKSSSACRGMGVAIGALTTFLNFQINWNVIYTRPDQGKNALNLSLKPSKEEMVLAIKSLNSISDGFYWNPSKVSWPKASLQNHVADSVAAIIAAKNFHQYHFNKYFSENL